MINGNILDISHIALFLHENSMHDSTYRYETNLASKFYIEQVEPLSS